MGIQEAYAQESITTCTGTNERCYATHRIQSGDVEPTSIGYNLGNRFTLTVPELHIASFDNCTQDKVVAAQWVRYPHVEEFTQTDINAWLEVGVFEGAYDIDGPANNQNQPICVQHPTIYYAQSDVFGYQEHRPINNAQTDIGTTITFAIEDADNDGVWHIESTQDRFPHAQLGSLGSKLLFTHNDIGVESTIPGNNHSSIPPTLFNNVQIHKDGRWLNWSGQSEQEVTRSQAFNITKCGSDHKLLAGSATEFDCSRSLRNNAEPEAKNSDVVVTGPTRIELSATDYDYNYLQFYLQSGPLRGTVGSLKPHNIIPGSDGDSVKFLYTPTSSGSDSITFKVTDSRAMDIGTVSIINRLPDIPMPPVASAVPSSTSAMTHDRILLDASASSDSNGDDLTYSWTQVQNGAPIIQIRNPNSAMAEFTVPASSQGRTVTFEFQVTVSDGTGSDTATVRITARLMPTGPAPIDMTDFALYVANEDSNSILAFAPNGTFIREFASTGNGRATEPQSLVFGTDGNLYVGTHGGKIVRFDKSGEGLGEYADLPGRAYKMTFQNGDLFAFTLDRIVRITGSGTVSTFGDAHFGYTSARLLNVRGGDFGPDGALHVLTTHAGTQVFTYGPDGRYRASHQLLDAAGQTIRPYGMHAAPDGTFFVTSTEPDAVLRYSADYTLIQQITTNYINNPQGVTVGPDLRLYLVNDGRDNIVVVFAQGSEFASSELVPRKGHGLDDPNDITIGPIPPAPSDRTPPVIILPADAAFEATAILTQLDSSHYGSATATDDTDSDPAITNNATGLFALGNTTIIWTATDSAGNNATAQQRITVRDTMIPVFAGTPPDIMIASTVPVPVTFDVPVASDIFPVTVSCMPDSGHTFQVDETEVICTATDSSDNTAEVSFRVIITGADTMPPEITAPADMTFEATGVLTPLNHTQYGTATAIDDEDPSPAITSDAPASFELGRTIITWTATDFAGNNSTAVQTITVQDTTPPEFGDASLLLFPLEEGRDNTNLSNAVPAASDLVDGTIMPECEPDPAGRFGSGAYTLTCTASDESDNHINATRTVIVYEGQEPRMQSVGDSGIAFVGNDYIHLLFQEIPGKPGYKCVIWTDDYNSRTINFTDGSPCSYDMLEPQTVYAINVVPRGAGEKAIFPYTRVITEIHLRDTVLPVIGASDDIMAEAAGPLTELDIGSATVTDNMDSNPIITSNDTGPYKLGTTIIQWSAIDYSGNTATALQRVIIQDTTRPIFTDALPDIRRESRVPIPITFDTPNATDIFPVTVSCTPESGSTFAVGTHTVSCTAADSNGNTATITFQVIITNGAVFQSITDNFENLDGWRPYHIGHNTNYPVNDYTISVADNTGRPAPSGLISGDGFGLQVGMEKIVSLENHTPGDPLYLGLDYRATSDTASSWATNAALRISHERGWPLLIKYFLLGGTADTGWRSHSMDISDIVSDRPRVRIQLILLDAFAQDHNQKAYYDNFYLGMARPSSGGASGQAEHTITYEQLRGFLDETGAVCAVYPDVSLQPLIDRYIGENDLDVRCGLDAP